MWQEAPTPEHFCEFPEGPLWRESVQPIWKCNGCGMEFDVTIGGWHFWWSPVTETGVKEGGTIYCSQERLCIVFPRVEFHSRGKMPNGYTLGTQVELDEKDIGPRPEWMPQEENGFIRDIAKSAPQIDREVHMVGEPFSTKVGKREKKGWFR